MIHGRNPEKKIRKLFGERFCNNKDGSMKAILLVILLSQTGDAQLLLRAEYANMKVCKKNAEVAANHFLSQVTTDTYQIICANWSTTIGGNQ